MKKILLSLVALFMGIGMAVADEVSFDASKQEYTNGQSIESIEIADGISATFAKGTNKNNAPKYYNTGTAIRCYGGNTFKIVSTIGNITQISFTFSSGEGNNEITADCGSFTGSVWVGDSESVGFAIGGTSGHRRIKVITVTYQSGESTGPKVVSIALTEASSVQTEYYEGDSFNPEGLVATATYDDETTADVTSKVAWSFNPASLATDTKSVEVTAVYNGVSASKTYDVTVKTIANTAETAYTVEEAVEIINAGKGLSTWVYVKGIISKVDKFNDTHGQIDYWISTDGTENGQQFMCYGGLNIGGEEFTSVDDLQTGLSVVVYGQLKKYGDIYEFNYQNKIVSMTTTGINDVNASILPANGKFVENGRVVIVKDGKKYNVAGQNLK